MPSDDRPLRDRLAAGLRARLRRYEETGDRRQLLAAEARAEAGQLRKLLKDPLAETDAVHALGMFHWTRAQLLPSGEEKEDLEIAVLALRVVHVSQPDRVPARLAVHIQEAEAGVDTRFRTEHGQGTRQLRRAVAVGDGVALAEAVRRFTEALRLMPTEHRERPGYLSDLGTALRTRYEQTGDREALESAIAHLREAVRTATSAEPARAMFLSNLGAALLNRYALLGSREDLAEALAMSRQAVGMTSPEDSDYAKRLSNLGGILVQLSGLEGEPTAADEAMDVLQRAVDAAAPSDPIRQRYLVNLAGALAMRGSRSADLADLDRAISALQSVVADVPASHPLRFPALNNLCDALHDRYQLSGSSLDLDACVDAGRGALGAIDPGHPFHANVGGLLGLALCDRFALGRNPADLEAAIALLRPAALVLPDGRMKTSVRAALGSVLVARCERSGSSADLDVAIQALEQAIENVPVGRPTHDQLVERLERARALVQRYTEELRGADEWIDRWRAAERNPVLDDPRDPEEPKVLNDLGLSLFDRFRITGDAAVLDEAVEKVRAAVRTTPVDAPRLAGRLVNLASLLQTRYELTGAMTDLDAADDAAREAVAVTPEQDTERAGRLSLLAGIQYLRCALTQEPDDYDRSVNAASATVRAAAPDDPELPRYRANLVGAFAARHERTGDITDLDTAIEVGRAAGSGDATALVNLGDALLSRYDDAGDPDDLREAVHVTEQAVESAPVGHPYRAHVLCGRSKALRRRFESTGDPEDLDGCLHAARGAVAATAPGGTQRPGALSALSNALSRRFELTGALADLDECVEARREAVRLAPARHRDLPMFHSNLAAALLGRHGLYDCRTDTLDEAVAHARQAVHEADGYHHSLHRFWGTLAAAFHARYRHTANAEDLDASVDAHRKALAATPSVRVERALALHNVGSALAGRFRLTTDPTDLDASLRSHREAAALAPGGAPVRGVVLLALGRALMLRYAVTQDAPALQEARVALEEAAHNSALGSSARVAAAEELARCHAETGDWNLACTAYEYAIELLPAVAPRHEERRTQESGLGGFASLASDAAACALHLNSPERALRLLEAGRGLLLTQALEVRTDVTELRRKEPELADRFTALRLRLDVPETEFAGGPPMSPSAMNRWAAEERRLAVTDFEALLADIRRLPDLKGFLRPPTTAELCAQAGEGPVVVVNTSDFRCDALILHPDRIQVVPLPDLTEADAEAHAESLAQAVAASQDPARTVLRRKAAQDAVHETLGWLWDVITEPVLDALGLTSEPVPNQPRRRIWWSPAGVLSTFPLHAAGHHTEAAEPGRAVLDRVVSSYIPTIRALAHSRTRPRGSGKVLAVALPETPGASTLAGAVHELRQLASRYAYTLTLTGPEATGSRVLAELPHHSVAHFACHAVNDPADPSSGRLLVHDHLDRPLSMRDIARLELSGDLAYLSACSTARSGSRFAAEAIHLTSAFQIAGYRHVIGTLWPIADDAAADIAADVYDHLPLRPDGSPDTDQVALALHHALRRIRDRYRSVPTRWASHLHVGR
ncbi:CHAT domain-containing protein [Streptomyces cyaneofuscatus]|uniref:CHAT domain-containing tetratricopeptide repeat protein n=1 Tax=Streptomyces cyaneofuscatus TaxID=66883 RepID=UPI003827A55F